MTGMEIVAVVGCVAAVCSAYRDGTELVKQIKEKRRARKELEASFQIRETAATQDLELSLTRGQGTVQNQYDRDFRRYGDRFAEGDQIARDALKDIIIHLQSQVISNLKIAWQQDTILDFGSLQDVSDNSQDRAVMALLQLQQRILTSAPIREIPYSRSPVFSSSTSPPQSLASTPFLNGFSPTTTPNGFLHNTSDNRSSPSAHTRSFPGIYDGPSRAWTANSTGSDLPTAQTWATCTSENEPEKKRNGTFSVQKLTIFKRSKPGRTSPRKTSENVPRLPRTPTNRSEEGSFDSGKNPVSSPADIAYSGRPRIPSVSTDDSSLLQLDGTDIDNASLYSNPWSAPTVPSTSNSLQVSRTPVAPQRVPTNSSEITSTSTGLGSQKASLPSEANKYAGFCPGAWRLQIGDRKKAMEERQRPGSMYNQQYYWKCKKCEFEGRLMKDGKQKICDRTIMSADGVQFRWEFLFKSHFPAKVNGSNPLASTFGCIFCCAEGRGTPTFGGVQAFIAHVQEHRDQLPEGEVLYRMGCVVGRGFGQDEDLDVSIMGRDDFIT